jgi:biopolymer transport protein TolR
VADGWRLAAGVMPKVAPIPDAVSGRLGRARRVSSSLAEINVVPLVDVMLVLLIIFMVTAPMIQRGVDVNLPVSTKAGQITNERVFVTVPLGYRQNHVLYLGDEAVRVDVLQERIRQKMENRSEKQVYLRGDGGVQYQELIDVFDRLKAAGVEQVGLVAKLPGER